MSKQKCFKKIGFLKIFYYLKKYVFSSENNIEIENVHFKKRYIMKIQNLPLKISAFILSGFMATSSFAGRTSQELLDANIDTLVIGGCGSTAPYGVKHPSTTLTLNLDPDAEADFTLDAFQYDPSIHSWLEEHFKGNLNSVIIEHVGNDSIIDVSSDISNPAWFITDPQLEDKEIKKHLEINSTKNFDEEDQRILLFSQQLIGDFLTSKQEQEKRPNFMKLFKFYVSLLKPGGSFEWQSGIFNDKDTEVINFYNQYTRDNPEPNQIFFENALNLKDVEGKTELLSESYEVYINPDDYDYFGKKYGNINKYHFKVEGYRK